MKKLKQDIIKSSLKANLIGQQANLAQKGAASTKKVPCRNVGINTGRDEIDISDKSSLSISQKSEQAVKHYLKNFETGEVIEYNIGQPVPEGWKIIKKKQKKKKM